MGSEHGIDHSHDGALLGEGECLDPFELLSDFLLRPTRISIRMGRDGQLFWTAPDQVTLTVPYLIGLSEGAHLTVTPEQINAAFAQNYSGTVDVNGTNVTMTAQAVMGKGPDPAGKVNFINVVKDTQGVTQSGRSETSAIGGNRITVGGKDSNPVATANTIAHELGHASGAGDQYKGGVDVGGNRINVESSGSSGIMKSLNGGPANQKTLGEILKESTNTN